MKNTNRYLVFLKAEYTRDAQGLLSGPVNDGDYDVEESWNDVSGPMLLMDKTVGSMEELKNSVKAFYPNADMSVFDVLCVGSDAKQVSIDGDDFPCLFEEVVSACDFLKELWLFGYLVVSHRSCYKQQTVQQAEVAKLGILRLAASISNIVSGETSEEEKLHLTEKLLVNAQELLTHDADIAEFCNYIATVKEVLEEEGDYRRWYHDFEEDLGEFWNEVELPDCVKAMFDAYVKLLATQVNGMVGPEPAKCDEIPESAWGLSLYDLSDYCIVFESEEAAVAFTDKHGVDPSEFLVWVNSGWQSV